MAEFRRRCLYRAINSVGMDGPQMMESMWAYTIQYPGADHRTPGRYRIRISKMTGAEFMSMMGHELEPEEIPIDYSMQAFIEKWGSDGWIHCIDWIGNPNASNTEIEDDLNNMFKAFTTGEPVGADFYGTMGPPSPPKPKGPGPKKNSQDFPKTPPPSDSDFDWI